MLGAATFTVAALAAAGKAAIAATAEAAAKRFFLVMPVQTPVIPRSFHRRGGYRGSFACASPTRSTTSSSG